MIELSFEILEILEPFVEVTNLLLAIVALIFAFAVFRMLKSDLRESWKYYLLAIVFFGLHEIVGSLEEFGIFKIEGFYALTELFFIVALLYSVVVLKRFFTGIANKGKKK